VSIDDWGDAVLDTLATPAFWTRVVVGALYTVLLLVVSCATPWPKAKPILEVDADYEPYNAVTPSKEAR
jgi:hypothetical protein